MKAIKLGKTLWCVCVAIWVISNSYFGWNKTPESSLETDIDTLIQCVFYLATGIYFSSAFKMYETWVRANESYKINITYDLTKKTEKLWKIKE